MNEEELRREVQVLQFHRRLTVGGAWVGGIVAGHRFQALVFAAPPVVPEWDVRPPACISKLWLQRIADKTTVFNWDRGRDIPAASDEVEGIIDALAATLPEQTWGRFNPGESATQSDREQGGL